jgi:ABC-2 type transport system ATP-binding protein
LTARELLAYYAGLYDDARPVDDVLADVGLADDADTWYENLSGGQKRRTCVGSALVNDPDLLVLDEPTTGIDPAGRRALWGLLENLAAAGTTVFLTTHYMEEAQRLADRVGLLADGALVALDTPAALVAEHGGDSRLRIEGVHATGAEAAPGDESGQTPSDPDRPAVDDEAVTDPLDYPASMDGTTMTVRDVQPEAIGDVVDALAAAGVGYESLTWTEPTLEEVYLELTGQSVTAGGKAVDTAVPSGDEPAPPREEGQL